MSMRRGGVCLCLMLVMSLLPGSLLAEGPSDLQKSAKLTLTRAIDYYLKHAASHGGFVYHYTLDFETRWGEGLATADQIWVQPPGTPTVGRALLRAYQATGEPRFLEAAKDAAHALAYGQLQSGGWTNCVDFDPRGQQVADYRNGKGKGKDNSTLDDGISQGALRFLIHVDQELKFQDKEIHDAAQVGLKALLAAQFPNGGFPQVWTKPVSPQPIVKANFPDYDWRTEGRIKEYWTMYTLNDNVAGSVIDLLIDAAAIDKEPRFEQAIRNLGDFLILSQMPEPQPAWAQQYNYQMQPIWARRFEPAASASSESQDVIFALLKIANHTGDRKYLKPIPAALAYLKKSTLPDGQLARYAELQTNRPLYMERNGKNYSLTYDDSRLPSHYGWKIASRVEELQKGFERVLQGLPPVENVTSETLETAVRQIIKSLDDDARWVTVFDGERLVGQPKFALGERYLSSELFSRNVTMLSEYLERSN